jgi:hypothetical protein
MSQTIDMPRRLRVVEPGESGGKPKVLSVAEAAALNDHRELLVALRSRIAAAVQSPLTNVVALAALDRQLVLISKELSVIDARPDDDLVGQAARVPDEAWDGAV